MERARESHWQEEWARARLADGIARPDREKFYAMVAYPGSSGFLHLGHLRGLTTADALHRYHRMLGRSVFFPTGTHATGLPAVTFAQKVAARDPGTVQQLELNHVPESEWPSLEDPATAARFLGRTYVDVARRLGILVDERAYVTTIDDDYQAFIRWQFHRLHAEGALVQAPHFASVCPVCGPVSVDPSETDLSTGGDAEWVTYTTVPFTLDDGRTLLAATLRPETVYGATNVWVPPDGALVVWHHDSGEFLVGPVAARRLVEQHGGRVGREVPTSSLTGLLAAPPLTGTRVPILPSPLVDPAIGTAVVMSVPSHAPADWLAIQALPETVRHGLGAFPLLVEFPPLDTLPPSERELLAGSGTPAERALRATGARSLADAGALEEATERLYRTEFLRGRMRDDLLDGAPVAQARERVAVLLKATGRSFDLQEFSIPVVCRNGHEVVIRRVPDQWFIRYSDPAWKDRTRSLVHRMTILPEEYRRELPGILDWYNDRPCTRRGRWLGTPFPLDPSWVIEPIADSTFYPVYFVIRPFVAAGRVSVEQLTDAFFDHVVRGVGPGEPTLPEAVQREVREAFLYWYPLDFNMGGKEHKRVHFPVFLATHALLLPNELQPRGLFVHWWLTQPGGEKISKKHIGKKGGTIPPIRDSIDRWGADAIRLFYAMAAGSSQDIEWSPTLIDQAQSRLEEVERLFLALRPEGNAPPELEAWLASELHRAVQEVRVAFARAELRDAASIVYVAIPALLRRFALRGGTGGRGVAALADAWVRLMVPITPHVAEELGTGRLPGLAAVARFPEASDFAFSEEALGRERFLDQVEEDLRDVLRASEARGERPNAVAFFVAAPWKTEVERWIRDAFATGAKGAPIREVMDRAKEHAEVSANRAEIPRYVQRVAPLLRQEPATGGAAVDEMGCLRSAEGYLARRFGFESVEVVPESEGGALDPMNRRERARPGRPAFYLIGRSARGPASPRSTPPSGDPAAAGGS